MSWLNDWRRCFCEWVGVGAFLIGCRPISSPVREKPPQEPTTPSVLLSAEDPFVAWERRREEVAALLGEKVFRLEVKVRYKYGHETYRGTAWLWDSEGYVVTCRHLIPSSPAWVEVELWDRSGSCRPAQVLWWDSLVDVVFLRSAGLEGEGLPLAEEKPSIGEGVFSVGAPWGLLGTLQEGFVSGEERYIETSPGKRLPFLQLSLPAQPGSSGSPVVDKRGRVCGMISDIASISGTYEGIAFAIPAQLLQEVWGRYRRFALGYDTAGARTSDK
ncbi:MAG: serine protease [Bacteroidia bacterium]|nr:serine protease [Bacteroidia bacterium]